METRTDILYVYLSAVDTNIDDLRKKADAVLKETINQFTGMARFEFRIPKNIDDVHTRKFLICKSHIIILGNGWEQRDMSKFEKEFAEIEGVAVWNEGFLDEMLAPSESEKAILESNAQIITIVHSRETRISSAIDAIRFAKEQTFMLYNQTEADLQKEASEFYDSCYETLKQMELNLKKQLKKEINEHS